MEADKKTVVFFIDSLGGGGAERVVSILSSRFAQTGRYDVRIVMMRKVPIAYPTDERVQLIYAQDIPVRSILGKLVRGAFFVYKHIHWGLLKPLLQKMGRYETFPKFDETGFFF